MRIFKTTWFGRFAQKEAIADKALKEVIRRIDMGQYDADLGGGVYKQRLSRPGGGKSGGYRLIVCLRQGERAFFVYGFPKSSKDNIEASELIQFKKMAKVMFAMTDKQLSRSNAFSEIKE